MNRVAFGFMQGITFARRFLVLGLAGLAPFALAACEPEVVPSAPANLPKAITIAEARALPEGSEALVIGHVTVRPGTFNSSTFEMGFAIQDDTGGIYVTMTEAISTALGSKIRAFGKLTQIAQLTALAAEPTGVLVLSESKTITPMDVKTGEVNEDTEGLLVHVKGKITQPVVDDSPFGFKVFIGESTGVGVDAGADAGADAGPVTYTDELQIFVHLVNDSPVISTGALMVDQSIEVTGFSGQYEMTYEVMPRRSDDLVVMK